MRISDWSSDVCSSDLAQQAPDVIGIGRLAFDQARQIAGDRGVLLPDEYDAAAQTSPQADDAAIFQYAHRLPKQGAASIMLLPQFLLRPYDAAGFIMRSFQRARYSVGQFQARARRFGHGCVIAQRRSEEHTSELQSLMRISYAVFCLKQKTIN